MLSPERILELQELVLRVPVAEHVVRYAVALVRATRPPAKGRVGGGSASPRASTSSARTSRLAPGRARRNTILGAKAKAILDGRPAASAEDVRKLARPILQHRLITNFHAEAEGVRAPQLIERLLDIIKP